MTDGAGNWSATGNAWAAGQEGFWTRLATIAGGTSVVNFNVSTSLTQGPPTAARDVLGMVHVGHSLAEGA